MRTIAGGTFAGDLADGVIKPNLQSDYAPSGMWDGLLGGRSRTRATRSCQEADQRVRRADADDHVPLPADARPTTRRRPHCSSLGKAGIKLKLEPARGGRVLLHRPRPEQGGRADRLRGWGPDWLNASTVIPPLFTPDGGFDLSQVNDKAFNAKVDATR